MSGSGRVMDERTTGATDEQIEAAAQELYDFANFNVLTEVDGKVVTAWSVAKDQEKYRDFVRQYASWLVPPGSAIVPVSPVRAARETKDSPRDTLLRKIAAAVRMCQPIGDLQPAVDAVLQAVGAAPLTYQESQDLYGRLVKASGG